MFYCLIFLYSNSMLLCLELETAILIFFIFCHRFWILSPKVPKFKRVWDSVVKFWSVWKWKRKIMKLNKMGWNYRSLLFNNVKVGVYPFMPQMLEYDGQNTLAYHTKSVNFTKKFYKIGHKESKLKKYVKQQTILWILQKLEWTTKVIR